MVDCAFILRAINTCFSITPEQLYNMNKALKKIIAFSLKNKYFILFSTLLLIIYGVITFRDMSIEAFPDVTITEITIITQWPGRSAEEVEKFVTIPIEIAL